MGKSNKYRAPIKKHEGTVMRKAKVHKNEDLKLYNRQRKKKETNQEINKEFGE